MPIRAVRSVLAISQTGACSLSQTEACSLSLPKDSLTEACSLFIDLRMGSALIVTHHQRDIEWGGTSW
ncbi:hypothetical protein ZOSMA_118G00350 [Zostera marina]|uniref:Uncharacterized protein n=1 Tax=Zostera marina TaxID=29655 RepID=A0A0K9Q3T1_ZOSMR|nr:hypothetical protein ZOSMA_118G00350 [Zostera marina]